MKRTANFILVVCGTLAALAACSSGPPRTPSQYIDRVLTHAPGAAQPSVVVAAELAFARAAQEKGQWTAFAEFAADDATMFVPAPVNAKGWLKGRTNPPAAVAWQPYHVWMSCDGSLAMTKGAWQQPNGTQGYFTTVWKRQADGSYRWVMDQGDGLEVALPEPEMIEAKVASCDHRAAITPPMIGVPTGDGTQFVTGESDDKTLRWIVRAEPDGSRYVAMEYWTGAEFERPYAQAIAAPAQ